MLTATIPQLKSISGHLLNRGSKVCQFDNIQVHPDLILDPDDVVGLHLKAKFRPTDTYLH